MSGQGVEATSSASARIESWHKKYAQNVTALQAEDKIGTMLPCNVIVQDVGGAVRIRSAPEIDPACPAYRGISRSIPQ
jgi:hypothetical protein